MRSLAASTTTDSDASPRLGPEPTGRYIGNPKALGEPAATDGPSLTIAHALDAADHLRFRDLQGDVYYLQLQRLDMPIDIPGAQAAPPNSAT